MSTTEPTDPSGAEFVKCLERAWAMLREIDPDIPPAIIVIMPIAKAQGAGSFTGSSWRYVLHRQAHEVAISPRAFSGGEDVLEKLLHEAAHAVIFDKDGDPLGGCSRTSDGRTDYHNDAFKVECLRLGLACERSSGTNGSNATSWPQNRSFPPRYVPIVDLLNRGLPKLL